MVVAQKLYLAVINLQARVIDLQVSLMESLPGHLVNITSLQREEEPSHEMDFTELPSSDDDIEEQCRQIFEDYTPDTATQSKPPEKVISNEDPTIVGKKRHSSITSNHQLSNGNRSCQEKSC
jgi:hypothetical protein